jgi:hypothetical protein
MIRRDAFGQTPGWRAAQMVEVHLEPEPVEAMAEAARLGWKAL